MYTSISFYIQYLTHTSGIANYYKYWNSFGRSINLNEMILHIKSWPLDFQPGNSYSYSNSGYVILAYIIERISKKTYHDYLRDHIFKPLNMHNTHCITQVNMLQNNAQGYVRENNELQNIPPIDNPLTLLGNGDICSTIEDLHKWDEAFCNEKLISKKSIDLMTTSHIKLSSQRSHGYGWFVYTRFGKKVVEYTGSLRGFLSRYLRFIDDNLSIIIISNIEDSNRKTSSTPDQIFKISDGLEKLIITRKDNDA